MINVSNNTFNHVESFQVEDREVTWIDKVQDYAVELFEFISDCMMIPFRTLGSKHFSILGCAFRLPVCIFEAIKKGSFDGFSTKLFCLDNGFTYFPKRDATKKEVLDNLGFASIISYIHKDNTSWLEPLGYKRCDLSEFIPNPKELSIDFEIVKGCLVSSKTGLKMSLIKTTKGYTVVFGAVSSLVKTMNTDNFFKDYQTSSATVAEAGKSLLGFVPRLYRGAEKAVAKLLDSEKLRGKNVSFTGSCLGGSIATYIGILFEKKTVCVNTFSIGTGLQSRLGEEKLKKAPQHVKQFIARTDYVADLPAPMAFNDIAINTLGIKTAGIFGEKLYIDRAFPMYHPDNHFGVFNNMLKHLDMDTNLRPKDFSPGLIARIRKTL